MEESYDTVKCMFYKDNYLQNHSEGFFRQASMELEQRAEEQQPDGNTSNTTEKKGVKIAGFAISLTAANVFFAFLSITGQVGMKVTIPLWVDSTILRRFESDLYRPNQTTVVQNFSNETEENEAYRPEVDAYFVLSFGLIVFFAIIIGPALLFIRVFRPHLLGETERNFPHSQMFLAGFFNALNGVFIVFASSGTRTPPSLQAILSNIMIPLIIALRYFVLRKKPTVLKFICAMIVLVSLFICLIPKIFTSIDPEADSSEGASGVAGILWPICYMSGSIPAAAFLVIIERSLQNENEQQPTSNGQPTSDGQPTSNGQNEKSSTNNGHVNIVFYLFWMHVYQLLTIVCLFWTDFVPGFGYADNIYHFWENWWFGVQCFFGGAGCDSKCGVRGAMFVLMYTLGYIGTANLTRFSEGATYVAVVYAAVTPLGFLFWTIFRESPFGFHPAIHIKTWFSIGGLVPMVPAIFFYTRLSEKN